MLRRELFMQPTGGRTRKYSACFEGMHSSELLKMIMSERNQFRISRMLNLLGSLYLVCSVLSALLFYRSIKTYPISSRSRIVSNLFFAFNFYHQEVFRISGVFANLIAKGLLSGLAVSLPILIVTQIQRATLGPDTVQKSLRYSLIRQGVDIGVSLSLL